MATCFEMVYEMSRFVTHFHISKNYLYCQSSLISCILFHIRLATGPPHTPNRSGSGRQHRRLRLVAAVDGADYSPENALLTMAAAGFGVPFSWNKP
jgi:hypothetical protein